MKKTLSLIFSLCIVIPILIMVVFWIITLAGGIKYVEPVYRFLFDTVIGWLILLIPLGGGIVGLIVINIMEKAKAKKVMKYYEEHLEEMPRSYTTLEDDVSYMAAHPELMDDENKK